MTVEDLQARIDAAAINGVANAPMWETVPLECYADDAAAQAPGAAANGHNKITAAPVVFRHISEIIAERREPEWLLDDILERDVLGVLAGPRSTFKSFVALNWSMNMAVNGHAGVILSGEGGGLDRRADACIRQHCSAVNLADVPLVALERPLNLTAIAEMESLRQAIEQLPEKPQFIVVDTLSKFSAGLDENDNGQMAAFLSGLSTLRQDLKCTILLVAHSGHGDTNRPRGASSLMCNPDAEYIVSRAAGTMTVAVSRERFKDSAALPPLAYEAKVIDLGRLDRRGRPVTSLALINADTPIPGAPAKGNGGNQKKVAIALKEWLRARPDQTHISTIDMRALCKAQGLKPARQSEVVTAFVANRILTPSVGGWALHGENL